MFILNEEFTGINADIIKRMIDFHKPFVEKYRMLRRYYNGEHSVLDRIKNDTLKNNKIVVNHASYITDMSVGYLLGSPVDYLAEDNSDISALLDCYDEQTINDLDNEIAKNVSIMGLQHEYIYADEGANPKSALIDNTNCLIAYDNTLEHKKIFGIIYRPIIDTNFIVKYYDIIYLDDKNIQKYKFQNNQLILVEENPHNFGKMPLIKYRNNPEEKGDFEKVLSLIDAYNLLQSDRINDKEQLVDAILCLYGFDFTEEQHALLKSSRVLASIPEDGRVEYLTKTLQESDMDILRRNLEQDIHKISMVPNMSDENFVGNSSGVALSYKLLPFEQNISNKERYFEKTLMERFEIYNNFLFTASRMAKVFIPKIDAIFNRNLPVNNFEISQIIRNLQGIVDNELLVSQLSFVKDAEESLINKNPDDNNSKGGNLNGLENIS